MSPELVQRAIGGDRAAVRALVDHLGPVIQARVARSLLRHGGGRGREIRQEVEDLTQDVFVALFKHDARALRRWDPERGASLSNFVGLIAEREVATIMRSGKKSPWTEDPTEAEDLDRTVGAAPASAEVRVASRQLLALLLDQLRALLSPLGMAMFRALLVEGRSADEVAREFEMKRDAVYAWKSRLGKLVRRLAAEMSDAEGPPRTPEQTASTRGRPPDRSP